mgnify:CR=1 FL=1
MTEGGVPGPGNGPRLFTPAFGCLTSANLLMACGFYALIPTLPLYLKNGLGLDKGETGVVLACFSVSALSTRPFAGLLLDSVSRHRVYVFSFSAVAVLCGVYALAASMAAMVVLRLVHGVAFALATTATVTLVADITPRARRGEGLGLFGLTMPLGMSVGPVVGLAVLAQWNATALFLMIMALSLLGLSLGLRVRSDHVPGGMRRFRPRDLLLMRGIPLSLVMLLVVIPYGGAMSFASLYAEQKGLGSSGAFFMCVAGAVIVARLVSGRAFDRGHVRIPLPGGMCVMAAGVFWLGCLDEGWELLGSGGMIGFGFGVAEPPLLTMVNNLAPADQRGRANSTFFIALDLGIGAGSLFTGYLGEIVNLGWVYRVDAVFLLIGFGLFFGWALPRYRRDVSGHAQSA